jgi:hypothetical protein
MHKIGKDKVDIEVISVWFNEALIAPYFLGHYSFADKIHIIIDADTTDDTAKIASEYNNVVIHNLRFPDKFDDEIKIGKIHEVYSSVKHGWVIAVDSDELVFPLPLGTDIRGVLRGEGRYDVLYAQMWDVYRHKSDLDLDPMKNPASQRRHGNPELDVMYTKPCVVKAGLDYKWECGCHKFGQPKSARPKNKVLAFISKVINRPKVSPTRFYGAHWRYADPMLVKNRVNNRKGRLSSKQLKSGMGLRFNNDELADLIRKCEEHLDDPLLF